MTSEIKMNDTITNSEEGDRKLNELVTNLQSAMLRIGEPHLPVWSSDWCDSENQTTFKAHIKAFENYATLLQWDSKIKALKLQMTLRGGIRAYIDTLGTEISTDYDKLKEELMHVYHQEKDPGTKIHDWNLIVWRPNPPHSMSLPALGAILLTKFKSFSKKNESAELGEIMLKKRFLEAVTEGDAKFASFIKLNLPADQTYKELIAFCAKKYQVYKHLNEVEEENAVGALYAGRVDDDRQPYYVRKRYERQRPVERPQMSEYDRRRQMWHDGNVYGARRYNEYGEREWTQPAYGHRREYPNFGYNQPFGQVRRSQDTFMRRENFSQPEYRQNDLGYQKRRWSKDRKESENSRNRKQRYEKVREEAKKGTTVPESRKIVFLEKKSKN